MKQPKALYLLNAVSMWECFSYYGMRALLLLFLVEELRYTDDRALSLYALYTTLVELGGMLGGFLADRYLGLKAAIFLGGCAIALGHICMAFGSLFPPCFLVGLGCIIAGTALFRPSVAALLGAFYDKEDSRREAGYTLYYAGINLGGLLASVLCGVVASIYGWSAGFILATFGMILGLSCLLLGRKYLQGHGGTLLPRTKNMQCMWSLGILGSGCVCACLLYGGFVLMGTLTLIGLGYAGIMHRQAIRQGFSLVKPIVWLLLCLVLFYACEEQLGSSLLLFAQRYVERGNIPAATLQAINPLTILLMGVVLSVFLKKRRWGDIKKLAVSFTLLGSAFFMLALCGYSLGGFVLALIMLSIGELFMGPTVLSSVAKKAPEGMQGFFMGSVTVGFSAASLFGGTLSRLILADPEGASLLSYQKGFVMIGCLACLGIVLMIRMYMLQRREEDADPSIVEG